MQRIGFKFLIIVFIASVLYSCKSSGTHAKHRPVSTKKTHKTKDNFETSTSKTSSAKVQDVVKNARSYTGVKYQYGGTTKSGIDCSGLVCASYNSVGITLPRSSAEQGNIGKRIYIGELLPGDLVFFATGSDKTKVTHVGLITEVKSSSEVLFIHASTSKGVREDNVHDTYWRPRYIKAVRPL